MNEILKNHGRAPVRSQILQISRAAVAVVTSLCGKYLFSPEPQFDSITALKLRPRY